MRAPRLRRRGFLCPGPEPRVWGVKIRVRPGERGHLQAESNFRTPHAFERFERLTRRLVSVPKAEADDLKKRERQSKRRRAARKA
jgi:hypothetical protein